METVTASLQQYGVLLVFANVLVQQLGAPVPAMPTLIVAGALSVTGVISAPATLAAAVLASLVADAAWYAAGIRYGRPVLSTLCRVSLSPDSCVRQSEDQLARWGAWALVIGKFVPGLSTMAPPVAGMTGLRPLTFVLASIAAAALYFGLGLALGVIFHDQVNEIIDAAARHAGRGGLALAALLAAYVGYRWLRRWLFLRRLRIARVSVDELRSRIAAGAAPAILDARSAVAREREPGIPGAVAANVGELRARPARLPARAGDRGLLQLPERGERGARRARAGASRLHQRPAARRRAGGVDRRRVAAVGHGRRGRPRRRDAVGLRGELNAHCREHRALARAQALPPRNGARRDARLAWPTDPPCTS